VRLEIDYVNPSDPEAKPPAVQKVVTKLHPGTGMDTSVPALCTASDVELMASGAAACPAASRVGGGEIDLDTGLPGPGRLLRNDVTLLNDTGQLIFLLESKNEPRTRFVARATIDADRATITSEVPPVPGGAPDGFTAIKRVRVGVRPVSVGQGARRRSYVTTPPSCPLSGTWTNTVTFTYRDGVSQAVASQSLCSRSGGRPDDRPPRIRLAGVPRKRCARRAFRARARIFESHLRRATLSLDGRRLLTTRNKRFSRRIRAGRPGRHRVTVAALDNAGNRSVKRARLRTCRRPRIALTG
jgi:hypothetical protein